MGRAAGNAHLGKTFHARLSYKRSDHQHWWSLSAVLHSQCHKVPQHSVGVNYLSLTVILGAQEGVELKPPLTMENRDGRRDGEEKGRLQLRPFMLPLFHTLILPALPVRLSQQPEGSAGSAAAGFDRNREPAAGRTCCASPRQCPGSASATHVDEAGELPAGPSSSRNQRRALPERKEKLGAGREPGLAGQGPLPRAGQRRLHTHTDTQTHGHTDRRIRWHTRTLSPPVQLLAAL